MAIDQAESWDYCRLVSGDEMLTVLLRVRNEVCLVVESTVRICWFKPV